MLNHSCFISKLVSMVGKFMSDVKHRKQHTHTHTYSHTQTHTHSHTLTHTKHTQRPPTKKIKEEEKLGGLETV